MNSANTYNLIDTVLSVLFWVVAVSAFILSVLVLEVLSGDSYSAFEVVCILYATLAVIWNVRKALRTMRHSHSHCHC